MLYHLYTYILFFIIVFSTHTDVSNCEILLPQVRKEAISQLPTGLRTNHTAILGATTLEFGLYYGQTFRWALENATGWVVGVVAKVMEEPKVDSFIEANKKLLERYALTFPLVKDEVEYKLASLKSTKDVYETGDVGLTLVRFGEFRDLSWRELSMSGRKEHRRLCEYVLAEVVYNVGVSELPQGSSGVLRHFPQIVIPSPCSNIVTVRKHSSFLWLFTYFVVIADPAAPTFIDQK